MELNREQVEKALDWLDSLVGNSHDSEIALFTYQLLGILYDTCEELTEENERLTAYVENLQHANTHLSNTLWDEVRETNIATTIDTVRKMQERLKTYYGNLSGKTLPATVEYHIDQIAKEILEETQDDH